MRHPSHYSAAALLALLATACIPANGGHPVGSAHKLTSDVAGDPAHNLLKQMDFEDGAMLPWTTSFTAPASGAAEIKDGALCVNVINGGENRWDAQIRHREMVIQKGHHYNLSFKAWASRDTGVAGKVGMSGPPYTDYWSRQLDLTTEHQPFQFEFDMTMPDDATAELALHFGGHMLKGEGPIEICFDDFVLSDPDFTPPPKAAKVPIPAVRVNQVGYLPGTRKMAALVTNAEEPEDWKVLDGSGKEVATGKTEVFGPDAASNDNIHLIDFSEVKTPGKGYQIQVGDQKSDPFDIATDIYSSLKYDSFRYFYLNRSGIDIKMPYAGSESVTRAAGHPKDVAACAAEAKCDYSLDVTGGWYDAGDFGKYVVNGGISAWTLVDWQERAEAMKGDTQAFADGKQRLPESGNGVPDILDEARWEMEFMLRMQVPEGKPNAGMAHHKMHDVEWTALGLKPADSKVERKLRPVSTAATLNLAATAAQSARVWAKYDAEFSKRCLKAAESAWAAAKKNPTQLALAADTTGGGPYDDQNVSDEFYWAAAELYVTTGKAEYLTEVESSKLDSSIEEFGGGAMTTPMTWQRVDVLGKITLATLPSKLTIAKKQAYRDQIVKVAEHYLEVASKQGYRVPFEPDPKSGEFPWGSNSFVVNNALIMALAYDYTQDAKYLDGVSSAMDYVLGRNALGQSYITGHGDRALQNPHHRFWANQANSSFPKAPPGALSGGPNSGLQDPYVQAAGLKGCAPQKCFVDNIEAWSTNEITINWNAPLVWVSAWLDEHGKN